MTGSKRVLLGVGAALLLGGGAVAQQTNVEWVEFANQTSTRLVAATGLGATDPDEKDYAWGDLDRDGDLDLVCMRKQQVATTGRRVNVLFMNEGIRDGRAIDGVLVDRTALYAQASDVAGDLGFNTPTNDRDAEIADVNGDGWLDVITCTTLSDGQSKNISHPRVYMNLGNNPSGAWLGLRYENARIPQLLTIPGGLAVAPRFCDLAAGDIDNDGDVDLYFTDYDDTETNINEPSNWDLNDRLLINDGNGFFTDSGTTRMSSSMLLSAFGMACEIADMNGDGRKDIVKDTALGSPQNISISYNNPNNVGFFNILQTPYAGSPYHVATGDLNNDGRLDLVIADDGQDAYKLNTGNDALGRVIWGPTLSFTYVGASDDGFPGGNLIRDLDRDGWNDVVIADVDVDVPGCGRRSHIFHNRGNLPNITMIEEAQSTDPITGWKGVKGMLPSDLQGTNDIAVFDINGDGWLDMVFGRCSGTFVWMNKPRGLVAYGTGTPWANGQVHLTANKKPRVNTSDFALSVRHAPPNAAGLIVASDQQDLAGTLDPGINAILHIGLATPSLVFFPITTDSEGNASFSFPLPDVAALAGFRVFLQAGVFSSPVTLTTSNGLDLTILP